MDEDEVVENRFFPGGSFGAGVDRFKQLLYHIRLNCLLSLGAYYAFVFYFALRTKSIMLVI